MSDLSFLASEPLLSLEQLIMINEKMSKKQLFFMKNKYSEKIQKQLKKSEYYS